MNGIAGYDFLSSLDRAVAFDYNGDRKQDLFFYRPGQGAAWVARSNGDGSFTAVYAVGDDGPAGLNGIAGYDFLSRADQALAFDYNGDGNKDLFFYRPGRGAAWVARSNGDGSFTAVYAVGDDGAAGLNGIGGFDLLSANDRAIALDYDGDGFEDLVFQPVGSDQAWVVRSNGNGTFASFTNAPGTLSGVVAASGGTADVLIGDNGNNVLRGANGNDTFIGSAGNDVLNGGSGTDTANYSSLTTVVRLGAFGALSKGSQGTDTLINIETIVGSSLQGDTVDHSGASSFPATGTVTNLSTGNVTVNGSAPLPLSFNVRQFENVVGSAFADTIIGNGDNNILTGGRGNDVLTGGAGRDRFRFLNLADGTDIIKDFTTPTSFLTPNSGDLIEVSQAGFGAVGLSQFTYNSFTGSLSFLGSQFAILENKPVGFNILRDVVFI
ncbi:MAG: calcium-binding protein [Cyanobacteriota bacterium]|nr:calcium-binding protein [Cyanobacteriota bacterium]